jgi:hypothetical protein
MLKFEGAFVATFGRKIIPSVCRCKDSFFFLNVLPIFLENLTRIIHFSHSEANYDLKTMNPISSALEGRDPISG